MDILLSRGSNIKRPKYMGSFLHTQQLVYPVGMLLEKNAPSQAFKIYQQATKRNSYYLECIFQQAEIARQHMHDKRLALTLYRKIVESAAPHRRRIIDRSRQAIELLEK